MGNGALGIDNRKEKGRNTCEEGRHLHRYFLLRLGPGRQLEQMHNMRTKKTVMRPAAQAQEADVHKSGWSTNTAIRGSKKFSSRLLNNPEPSSRYAPSGMSESEQLGDLSFESKHSHLGLIVPFTVFA